MKSVWWGNAICLVLKWRWAIIAESVFAIRDVRSSAQVHHLIGVSDRRKYSLLDGDDIKALICQYKWRVDITLSSYMQSFQCWEMSVDLVITWQLLLRHCLVITQLTEQPAASWEEEPSFRSVWSCWDMWVLCRQQHKNHDDPPPTHPARWVTCTLNSYIIPGKM